MTVDARPQTLPFSIENAFTDRIEGGNPAAIVRVPTLTALPDPTLQSIAANFNQPITVFVAPRETNNATDPPGTATFGIRWFTPEIESPLCGHGALAAAGALFRGTNLKGVSTIRFEARTGKLVVARQVEDARVEIDLDVGRAEPLVGAEDAELREVLVRALGKDVCVKYAGRGLAHLDKYTLIEVDTHDLGGLKVDTEALVSLPRILWVCLGVDYLAAAGEPFLRACRHRAIVCPGSSVRVEGVCASCRSPRGPGMWHRAHIGDAVLDGHEEGIWGGQCEAGQCSWWGP
jgi:predicted PhzF superfamily epimerase YddE/YHI9